MFIIKNSIKNIYRYKNKYILFGILYLIIILVASLCVNIFVQMGKITDNILKEYAGVVRFDTGINFTKNKYLEYKNIEHIENMKFFRYNFATNFLKENVSELEVEFHIADNVELLNPGPPVFILGYNMSLLHLAKEDFKIETGRMFENDDECVIAQNAVRRNFEIEHGWQDDLDNWNYLDIGDIIIIKNDEGIYKKFTIVGIQEEDTANDANTIRRMLYTTLEGAEYFTAIASNASGLSYITAPIGENINHLDFNPLRRIYMGLDVLIYLDSPESYFDLRNIMHKEADIIIEPLFPNFRTLINLTQNMQTWSIIFMIIIGLIIISITIISAIILLNNRKYEIAVLRSVGMKKSKLIVSYLIENLAFIWGISIISLITAQFITGIFTGNVFAGIQNLVSPEMFESLTHGANLELLLKNIGIVFGGTTVVVMLSLILACINIIRFEPLKIFNKQY